MLALGAVLLWSTVAAAVKLLLQYFAPWPALAAHARRAADRGRQLAAELRGIERAYLLTSLGPRGD